MNGCKGSQNLPLNGRTRVTFQLGKPRLIVRNGLSRSVLHRGHVAEQLARPRDVFRRRVTPARLSDAVAYQAASAGSPFINQYSAYAAWKRIVYTQRNHSSWASNVSAAARCS